MATPTTKSSTPLSSSLGLSLAQSQTNAMNNSASAASTAPSSTPSAPTTSSVATGGGTSGTTNTAATTVNKQTGQTFQNATTGPYTLQNAQAAGSGAVSPGVSNTNPLGQPMQPFSYFLAQNPTDRKAAQQAFQAQKKKNTATDNYNNSLSALGQLDTTIGKETQNQNQRNEVKFAQDSQANIDYLKQQNDYQNQMNDISFQNQNINAQNNVDKLKQSAAYLAGGIGAPSSAVGIAGQNKDISDAVTFLNNLGLAHNLQNSSSANSLAYQVNNIKKTIDLNVSGAVQNALAQIGKLDSMGDLNSVESVMKARGDILENLKAIRQQMTEQNIPYLKALMEQDQAQHTVDPTQTSLQNDGTLYNKFGTPILGKNGQALKISNYTGTLMSSSPITLSDGSSALVFKNTDGSLRTEKIKDTGTMLSDDSVTAFARMIATGRANIGDIPKGMQDAVLAKLNNYNSSGSLTIGSGNLSGAQLMATLASGKYDGKSFFGVYATGDPTGQNRANIYTKAQNMGLEDFIGQYKGTPITPEMVNASAQKFGVDPLMVATIMAADSSMGTNWYGKGRGAAQNNNPGNYGQNDSDSAKGISHGFSTMQEGVDAVAKNLQHRLQALQTMTQGTLAGNGNAPTADLTPSYKDYMNNGSLPTGMKAGSPQANDFLAGYTKWRTATNPIPKDVQQRVDSYADDYTRNPNVQSAFKFAPLMRTYTGIDVKNLSSSQRQGIISDYAKALDPDSVVREGEYATVAKYSSSWGEKTLSEVKQFLAGEGTLSDAAAQKVVDAIVSRGKNYMEQEKAIRDQYTKKINKATGYNDGEAQLVTPEYQDAGAPSSSTTAPTNNATINNKAVEMPASNGKTYSIPL